jgi:hypothetical protein
MCENSDIEVKFSAKHLPLDYKLLEWRLILNRELYEEKVIDLKVFSLVESSILGRMKKIRNEVQNNRDDDLTIGNFHGNIASS